jgi:hypothetical protein
MRSWHDYRLIGYSVDGVQKEVTLRLLWTEPFPAEVKVADVVFSGVLDYLLEGDLGTNIIAAIAEVPIEPFVHENASLFERESKKYGWPRSWKGSISETIAHLTWSRAKLWTITSSYGLGGWVLASGAAERAKAA